jgi:hypothetical protein
MHCKYVISDVKYLVYMINIRYLNNLKIQSFLNCNKIRPEFGDKLLPSVQ